MAQSNHHRPDSPAGNEQRPARRHNGGTSQRHPALPDFARHSFDATSLLVSTTEEPRTIGVRVCIGLARS